MSRSVIAYFRMSDDDQVNSIERQRQTYHTFLKNNQDDYESLGEFVEAGKSGDACVTRPVQDELLTKIEQKELKPDVLWVSESSRWGRFDTNYKYKFILPLKKAGIKLRANQQEIDFCKPESDLLYDVSQSMSYIENHQRAERVTSGIAVLVSQKKLSLAKCYGLKKAGSKLIQEPEEAEIVKRIFTRYLERGSLNNVVHWLNNELQIPSPCGAKWSLGTVRSIIRNPKISGHYVYGRRATGKIFCYDNSLLPKKRDEDDKGKETPQQNYFMEYAPEIVEPIIDLDTWAKAQLTAVENARPRQRLKGKKHKYTGVLLCRCDKPMRGRRRGPVIEYTCTHGRAGGCTSMVHYEVNMDTLIKDVVNQLTDPEEVYNKLYEQNESGEKAIDNLAKLKEQYATGQRRLNDLEGMLPDGFVTKLRNIKKEIDMLEQKSNTVLDLTKLRLAATESARYYRAKLDEAGAKPVLTTEFIRDTFKEIKLNLERVKSVTGKRQFCSIKSISISAYMGKSYTHETTGYPAYSHNVYKTVEFNVDVPLPLHFERCTPDPW